MLQRSLDTQFGPLCVSEDDGSIVSVSWQHAQVQSETDVLTDAIRQLAAYCSGELVQFDLPLKVLAAPLVQSVCQVMQNIKLGDTRTYGDIAQEVGASAQAVGQACGANPIPVIIPCHRVMGAGGRLTGFSGAGGVETKVALLRHEKAAGLLI